jgi:hypothetical protein
MKQWKKAKKGNKKFESKCYLMETLKQLLARSRYLLYKNKSKWSENQIERASILFELSDIEKAYNLAQDLRNIFEKTTDKIIGLSRLADGMKSKSIGVYLSIQSQDP